MNSFLMKSNPLRRINTCRLTLEIQERTPAEYFMRGVLIVKFRLGYSVAVSA